MYMKKHTYTRGSFGRKYVFTRLYIRKGMFKWKTEETRDFGFYLELNHQLCLLENIPKVRVERLNRAG